MTIPESQQQILEYPKTTVTLLEKALDQANELSRVHKTGTFFNRRVRPEELHVPDRMFDGLTIASTVICLLGDVAARRRTNATQVAERRPMMSLCNQLMLLHDGDVVLNPSLQAFIQTLGGKDVTRAIQRGLVAVYTHLLPYITDGNHFLATPLETLLNSMELVAAGIPSAKTTAVNTYSMHRPLRREATMPRLVTLPMPAIIDRICAAAELTLPEYVIAGKVYNFRGGSYLSLREGEVDGQGVVALSDEAKWLRLR